MIDKQKEVLTPLFSKEMIEKRIRELSSDINLNFADKNPIFIGVLNGGFIFLSDLIREMKIECELDFIKINSYDGKKSTGQVENIIYNTTNIENRHLIIVEDIIDTGFTINFLLNFFKIRKPASISIVTLLHKPESLKINLTIDYIGFEISPSFVVGYGLDYNQKFRNLDSIYILKTLRKKNN